MLQNGNITVARIIASCLVTLACVGVCGWIVASGQTIPLEIVWIAITGVGGVVGVDVVAALVKRGEVK